MSARRTPAACLLAAAMLLVTGCGSAGRETASSPADASPDPGRVFTTGNCVERTPIPVRSASVSSISGLPPIPGIEAPPTAAPVPQAIPLDDGSIVPDVALAQRYLEAELTRPAGESAKTRAARLQPMQSAGFTADGPLQLGDGELALDERAAARPLSATRTGSVVSVTLRAVQRQVAPDGSSADFLVHASIDVVRDGAAGTPLVGGFSAGLTGPC